jgi:hypothetical protein
MSIEIPAEALASIKATGKRHDATYVEWLRQLDNPHRLVEPTVIKVRDVGDVTGVMIAAAASLMFDYCNWIDTFDELEGWITDDNECWDFDGLNYDHPVFKKIKQGVATVRKGEQ